MLETQLIKLLLESFWMTIGQQESDSISTNMARWFFLFCAMGLDTVACLLCCEQGDETPVQFRNGLSLL